MSNTDKALKDTLAAIMEQHGEIDAAKEEIKVMLAGLKALGYDTATLRKVITRMKKDREEVIADDETMMGYEASMGMDMPNW